MEITDTLTETITDKLAVLVGKTELTPERRAAIVAAFEPFEQVAAKWEASVMSLVVVDEDDTELMTEARETRLELRRKRLEVEAIRKGLKEGALREGQLIDGIAGILSATISPLEDHLKEQETFAERAALLRDEENLRNRSALLEAEGSDSSIYNLVEMTPDQFAGVLKAATASRLNREQFARDEAQAREAEQQRLEGERIQRIEEDRLQRIEAAREVAVAVKETKRLAAEEEEARIAEHLANTERLAKYQTEHKKELAKVRSAATRKVNRAEKAQAVTASQVASAGYITVQKVDELADLLLLDSRDGDSADYGDGVEAMQRSIIAELTK